MATPTDFMVLPAPLSKYLEYAKVTKIETPETFNFMLKDDKNAYLAVKTVLDAPGNEWIRSALKSQPINMRMYPQNPTLVLTGFLSDLESYIPCFALISNYKIALMDWNTFVLQYKTLRYTLFYQEKQFTQSHLESMPEYNHWIAIRVTSEPYETKRAAETAFWKALGKFSIKNGGDFSRHFFVRIVELGMSWR